MTLVLALLLSGPARASCTLAALETWLQRTPDGQLLHHDRWTWRVEPGEVDCATIDLASPEAAALVGWRARVERPDGKDPQLGPERWEAVELARDPGYGPSPGVRLHAPELRLADLLVVDAIRLRPAGDAPTWRPGARGALEIASLTAPADLAVEVLGVQATPQGQPGLLQQWWLEAVPAGEPDPASTVARSTGPARRWSYTHALLLPERKPLLALGDDKDSRTLRSWRQEGGGERLIPRPLQDPAAWCRVGGQPCPQVGGVAWKVDADQGVEWGTVEAGSWISGEVEVPPAEQAEVAVLATRGQVVLHAPWSELYTGAVQGATALELHPDPALRPEGLGDLPEQGQLAVLAGPGRVGWRLKSVDGVGVLPDRRAAEQLVARLAVQASIPEPGPGAELKGRKEDATVLPDLLAAVRARLGPGLPPGTPQLGPRTLVKARRSGWGTPWELALVLTRYLGQLHFEALPVPVRPRELGPPDPAAVEGWPDALVRVTLPDGQQQWLDPDCLTCAPGQLLPRFDQAWTLSPELQSLPALPASSWLRRRTGPDTVEVAVTGPLAVELRARMAEQAPAERRAWLARTLASPGARLAQEQGLSSVHDDVRLWFEDVQGELAPPLQAPSAEGPGPAFLPARGTWVEEGPLPAGAAAPEMVTVEAPGLRWTRGARDGAWREELVVEDRQVERGPAHRVLRLLQESWGLPPG